MRFLGAPSSHIATARNRTWPASQRQRVDFPRTGPEIDSVSVRRRRRTSLQSMQYSVAYACLESATPQRTNHTHNTHHHSVSQCSIKGGRRSRSIAEEPWRECFFFLLYVIPTRLNRFRSISTSKFSWKCECFLWNYATRFHGTQIPDARIKSWQLLSFFLFVGIWSNDEVELGFS